MADCMTQIRTIFEPSAMRHDKAPARLAPWMGRMRAILKDTLFWIYLNCGYIRLRDIVLSLLGRSRAIILCYHRIGGCDSLSKPAGTFRRDLEYLKKRYRCVSLSELSILLQSGQLLRRPLAVITFDDGYRDNLIEAMPALVDAGVPATFFVATGFIGTARSFEHDLRRDGRSEYPKLTWDDLRSMQQAGFEIGSHTIEHSDLGTADAATVEHEVRGSLESLDRELGARPRAFAFPWGKPWNISQSAVEQVKGAGYYAALSAFGGTCRRGCTSFSLRRIDAGNGLMSNLAWRARVEGLDFDFLRMKWGLKRTVQVLVFVAMMSLSAMTSAATIYVAPNGSDAGRGSLSEPMATPAAAIDRAQAGDTICLRGGRYVLDHFLWVDKPNVTIQAYQNEPAKLEAPTLDRNDTVAVIIVAADGVSLVNLDIAGGGCHGVKVDVDSGTSTRGVRIKSCRIHDTGTDCVKTYNADDLLIEDCDIGPSGLRDPSNAEGIDSIGSKGVIIRRCHIHDTATNGVYLKGGARDGVIEDCLVERTGKFGGILLGQDTDEQFMRDGSRYEAIDCVARNNIIVETGSAGLGTYSGSNVRFENNTLVDVAREGQAAFWVVTNSRGIPAQRVTFRNNIVKISGAQPFVLVKELRDSLISDWNIYCSTAGRYTFCSEPKGADRGEQYDLEQWRKRMGTDAHSQAADPMLADGYLPQQGSPAITPDVQIGARGGEAREATPRAALSGSQ
jgi:peptidoglycan/xylan/chitin deacetylase (PgdA/CDA1 family)